MKIYLYNYFNLFSDISDILRRLGIEKECIKENSIDEDEEIPEI